jgi:L-prolyl-PCP dehydrogenase
MLIPDHRGLKDTSIPAWNPRTPGRTGHGADERTHLAQFVSEITGILWGGEWRAVPWLDRAQVMWNIGRRTRDQGLIVALGTHFWAANVALARFAGAGRLEPHAASLIADVSCGREVAAFAMTEENGGSNTTSITTAVDGAAGKGVTGRKRYISNVGVAAAGLVFAVERSPGAEKSVSCHLVDLSDPSVTIFPHSPPRALVSCPLADIAFSGTPSLAQVGQFGQGPFIFNAAMEFERTYMFAGLLGVADSLLCDVAAELGRARSRDPGLNGFAGGPTELADLTARSMACWELIASVAASHDSRQREYYRASAVKNLVSGLLLGSASLLARLRGARGATEPASWQQLLDGHASATFSGTTEIQNMIIARGMGITRSGGGA